MQECQKDPEHEEVSGAIPYKTNSVTLACFPLRDSQSAHPSHTYYISVFCLYMPCCFTFTPSLVFVTSAPIDNKPISQHHSTYIFHSLVFVFLLIPEYLPMSCSFLSPFGLLFTFLYSWDSPFFFFHAKFEKVIKDS